MTSDLPNAGWRKSARSNGATTCVEAVSDGATVAVRNSTDPSGPQLTVSATRWLAFLDVVVTGRLDHAALPLGVQVPAGPFGVTRDRDDTVRLQGAGPVVRFTRPEWEVFTAGVTQDGEFTLPWLLHAASDVTA
jgi:hypothetical protein